MNCTTVWPPRRRGDRACAQPSSRGEELAAATQSTHGVTYANKVSPEEAQIDWSASAVEIDRKVRAFNRRQVHGRPGAAKN